MIPNARSTRNLALILTTALVMSALALGCKPKNEEPLSDDEAREAMDEALVSSQAQSLTYDTVEVTTNFTIGMAVEDAAAELRDFVKTQIPCTDVTIENATINIDYGTLEDACVYRGKTYAGIHTVKLNKNEMDGVVEVGHTWTAFTDGNVTVDGTANVTWDANALSRRVEHDLSWSNGTEKTFVGTGDRTQSLIDAEQGLAGGIEISGMRSWNTDRGTWDLDIDGVQVRGQDPVPQAGTYTLHTPDDKTLTLAFTRLDEDTIEVKLEGTRFPRTFKVTKAGAVSE